MDRSRAELGKSVEELRTDSGEANSRAGIAGNDSGHETTAVERDSKSKNCQDCVGAETQEEEGKMSFVLTAAGIREW